MASKKNVPVKRLLLEHAADRRAARGLLHAARMGGNKQPRAASRRILHGLRIGHASDLIADDDLRRHRTQKHGKRVRLVHAGENMQPFIFSAACKELLPLVSDGNMQPLTGKPKRSITQKRRFSAAGCTQHKHALSIPLQIQ